MRITIVQGAFLPVPPVLGGAVEKVWFALGKEFAKAGHSVTHISRRYPGFQFCEAVDGVDYLRTSGFDTPASLLSLKLRDLWYSIRARALIPMADILVTNTFWMPILVRSNRCGKLYVHVARYPKGQLRFYAHAARLHTVSQAVAEAIAQQVPELAPKVRVIPYPLTAPETRSGPDRDDILKEKTILFVGRVHPEKGVELLIRAFAATARGRLKDWRLIIVGPSETRFGGGGERYLAGLRALAGPVADRIELVGAVFDEASLMRIYQAASLFVYPSLAERGETFGLAPLEAMAHGCVPVVSNLPCFRDYITHGITGRIFNHHVKEPDRALRAELEKMVENPKLFMVMSAAASRKAMDYNLPRIAKLHLADFEALSGKSANIESSRIP